MNEIEKLEQSLAAIQAQRAALGDAAVDVVLPLLRAQIAALKEQKTRLRQRKMITVLFADVSGFTAMAEKMDAEDVMSLINQVWLRLDQIILEHGGVIDKHIGDAVMALWGVEEAREDDPERAVNAALAMQNALGEFQAQQPWPAEFHIDKMHMHTGINTGPVLLGMVGSKSEFTAMGDTVNIASRIVQAAPMGRILISQETYRQVRGLFDVQEQPALEVKGKTEPLCVYLIENARPQVFRPHTRGVEGVETRMVGREDELLSLQTSLQTVSQSCCAQTIVIVGDAGLGKSRLLYEFEKWAEILPLRIQTFRGRASQQTQGIPFGLFRSLFAHRMDILDNDPLAVARQKLTQGMAEITQTDSHESACFIGQMIGLDFSEEPQVKELLSDPARLREQIFHHTTQFFNQAASLAPVALYLDDIHWADQGSLDLLEHLARTCQASPVLILCLTRPTLYENHPEWWAQNQDCMAHLDLKPLSPQASLELADEILRMLPAVPPHLRDMVTSNAEGNPFYMEELIKMLIDDGVILTGAQGWRIQPGKLIQARVPSTLTGVLQSRLDSLPGEEKTALQRASVVGRVFWDNLIAQIGHGADPIHVPAAQALLGLTRRELVYTRSTSSFAGANEYIFKHHILQDITYETVLKEKRKIYHGQVAAWLVSQSGERAEEHAALIAEHYEKAGQPIQAAGYLYHAAGQAYALTAFNDAIAALEHALAILPAHNQAAPNEQVNALRFKIHARLGEIYSMGKSAHEQAKPHLEIALQLARARKDESGQAAVLGQLGRIAYWQGEYEKGQTYLQEALPLARKLQDYSSTMLILRQLGNIATEGGVFAQAQTWLNESLALARALGDSESAALALNTLGNNDFNQGNFKGALAHYEDALGIFRSLGKRIAIGVALGNIGLVHYQAGDYVSCKKYQAQALEVARAIGNKSQVAFALSVLGGAAVMLGEFGTARAHLDESLHIFWSIGETPFLLGTLPDYARLFGRTDNPEQALELLGLVRSHPAALSESRQAAEKVLAELRTLSALSEAEIEAALKRGAAMDLEETVKILQNGL